MAVVDRFDVYLVNLDSTVSRDAKNTRPAVVISPRELNAHIETVILAPLSSTKAAYPTRVKVEFLNSVRYVILDQINTVERSRLVKKIGTIDIAGQQQILERLAELFAE